MKLRPRHPSATPTTVRHTLPATELHIGDHLRDYGALHTIDSIDYDSSHGYSTVTVTMENGCRLAIPALQDVTIWRDNNGPTPVGPRGGAVRGR